MEQCNYCKAEVSGLEIECSVCTYPVGASDKEQAAFVAKMVMQKSEVEESIKHLKRSRIIHFLH